MTDLATPEHHRLHGPDREEERALPVAATLLEDVRTDEGERQGEQPVVEVGQPDPQGQPPRHEQDHAAHDRQRHEAAREPGATHADIVAPPGPAQHRVDPGTGVQGQPRTARAATSAQRGGMTILLADTGAAANQTSHPPRPTGC